MGSRERGTVAAGGKPWTPERGELWQQEVNLGLQREGNCGSRKVNLGLQREGNCGSRR